MDKLYQDCILIILNYLSIESARSFGLTCSKHFGVYRKYVCAHPTLNHFKEILIKIREKEAIELVDKEDLDGFTQSQIYKDLHGYSDIIHYAGDFKPDFRGLGRGQGRGNRIPRPEPKKVSPEESDTAYKLYLKQLDSIIFNTRQNKQHYNSLLLPTFVKYLINIWFVYPSKYIRLGPLDILKQYLADCEELDADYCLLFKTTQRCCTGPHISDNENIWNVKDKMVDLDEVLIAFSRAQEDSFLFGAFDIEGHGNPPLTICNDCEQSLPCPAKCKYYFIDYENRFPENGYGIGKKKLCEVIEKNRYNCYGEGVFLEVFDYFVKHRYLLR